jgi:hypothetical protein
MSMSVREQPEDTVVMSDRWVGRLLRGLRICEYGLQVRLADRADADGEGEWEDVHEMVREAGRRLDAIKAILNGVLREATQYVPPNSHGAPVRKTPGGTVPAETDGITDD